MNKNFANLGVGGHVFNLLVFQRISNSRAVKTCFKPFVLTRWQCQYSLCNLQEEAEKDVMPVFKKQRQFARKKI